MIIDGQLYVRDTDGSMLLGKHLGKGDVCVRVAVLRLSNQSRDFVQTLVKYFAIACSPILKQSATCGVGGF